ncbi:MAG: hypothetical protein DI598_04010 [Pseudopedobacter saltans]|uniref:PKD domain-containing protein n=1 Tax=Pseudopedobacter saltans TaxID=151895 RepID=A0A2W5F6R1_9SPHI|nr:MAG: hypothetical protein DI598_04010 [Pseudopedobacter saltans]
MIKHICILLLLFSSILGYSQQIQDCNTWANFTTRTLRGIAIGNIAITGQHLTIEAEINPSVQYTLNSSGDIVSKHAWPADCNYLLRPDRGQITLTNGVHYSTPPICATLQGKTYHVAMTYDGEELVFYRNGIRMSSIKCSGNLIQNNWNTVIGTVATQNSLAESYTGYINEVRIWNVTRTQNQIFSNMITPLTNPTSESGLLAYYRFNSLKNLQGNTAFDGTLSEAITYPVPVPSCILADNGCPSLDCNLTSTFDIDQDICDPAHFKLANTTSNVVSYLWRFGDNIANQTTPNTEVKYQESGIYTISLKVSDNNGCSGTTSKSVSATVLPNVIENTSEEICKGQTVTLVSSISDQNTQYRWTPTLQLSNSNQRTTIATMEETTNFHLSVEKENGCQYDADVLITVPDAAKFAMTPTDSTVCNGKGVTLLAVGGDSYEWQDNEGNILGKDASLDVVPSKSETYKVDISNTKCGERASLSSTINVFPETSLSIAVSNTIDCANPSAQLYVKDGRNVVWETNETLTPNGNNAVIKPTKTTTYSAKIEDKYGCPYEVSYTQVVAFDPSSSLFFIPSAFTPNGDGKNDIFIIISNVAMNKFSLRIFNRYGQLVFNSQNQEHGWNGRYKNELQPTGTYIYEVVGNSSFCGEYHKKGTIVLIR